MKPNNKNYMANIFYDTSKLSIPKKKQLLKDAKNVSYRWWVDKLNCSKSIYRQKIEMSWNDILNKLTNKCHFTIIYRQPISMNLRCYYEISFSNFEEIEYFLWIFVSPEKMYGLLDKYNLKIKK